MNCLKHKKKSLILNKNFQAIGIVEPDDAIGYMIKGGRALDHSTYEMFDMQEWVRKYSPLSDKESLTSEKFVFCIPDIIVLKTSQYKARGTFSRRKVLVRDRYVCQYCGATLSGKTATIDHVVPRTLGGKNTFDNVVACCHPCNAEKGDKTLVELGWALKSTPKSPSEDILLMYDLDSHPESWNPFVGK